MQKNTRRFGLCSSTCPCDASEYPKMADKVLPTASHIYSFGRLQRHSFNDHSLSLSLRLVLLLLLHPSSGTLFLLTLDLQTVSHVLNADWNLSCLRLLMIPRPVQCHRRALIRVFMRLIALLQIVLVVVVVKHHLGLRPRGHKYHLPICPNNLTKRSFIPRRLLGFLWSVRLIVSAILNICICSFVVLTEIKIICQKELLT